MLPAARDSTVGMIALVLIYHSEWIVGILSRASVEVIAWIVVW